MHIFSMIFAALILAALTVFAFVIGAMFGWIWTGAGIVAILLLAFWGSRPEDGPAPEGHRHGSNAFQKHAS